MTPITKDALSERLFEGVGFMWKSNGAHRIWVLFLDEIIVRVDQKGRGDGPDCVDVPNCTTLEQLDQLILMFLK